MSTSLPEEIQLQYLRSIVGLENVELLKPGYAVEYDSIDPRDLESSFMSKFAKGLFLAGQVNRTSGYEEAAAQGLWAGINAGQYILGEEFVVPDRSRSYMETLVDDLSTKGTEEPYRLFTSRSEYRLFLREDNAHERLFALANKLNLLTPEQLKNYDFIQNSVLKGKEKLIESRIRLNKDRVISYFEYLKRPEINWESLDLDLDESIPDLAIEKLEIEAKYAGYLQRQEKELLSLEKMKQWTLDSQIDISGLPSLSCEVLEKYQQIKPRNVEELSKISGISPVAILTIAKKAGIRPRKTL